MPKRVVVDSFEPDVVLTEGVRSNLEEFVLIAAWDEAVERIEALRFLLDEWLDDGPNKRNLAGEPLRLERAPDGSLRRARSTKPKRPAGTIPRDLLAALVDEVLGSSRKSGMARWFAVTQLLGEWHGLLVDDEKLVGHLLRAHQVPAREIRHDTDGLIARHAALHDRSRGQ